VVKRTKAASISTEICVGDQKEAWVGKVGRLEGWRAVLVAGGVHMLVVSGNGAPPWGGVQ